MKSLDPFQHVSMQIKVLDFFCLSFRIPYSKKSVNFWLRVVSRICTGVLVFVIPTGAQIVYLTRLILSGNAEVNSVAAIINLVMTEMLTECKLLDMRLRRSELEHLFDQFTSKEFQYNSGPHRVISERAVKISRWLFLGILCSASMDILFHVVVVPALGRFETLPLKMDFIFFDVDDPKYFRFVCAYQILYKPCMVSVFTLLLSLPWAAMSFTISQLDILIYNFENIKESVKATRNERSCDENEAFREIFKGCVLHHSAIKRFINTLQAVFSLQMASSLFLNVGIIGTTAMQFLSIESPMKNFVEVLWVLMYMAIFVGMLFVDCYFGDAITEKVYFDSKMTNSIRDVVVGGKRNPLSSIVSLMCVELSTKVYECPWTDLDIKQKRNLVLFLASTQRPVVIWAAKLIPVSLQTFTKVMNWTYQGFAVLNQMK